MVLVWKSFSSRKRDATLSSSAAVVESSGDGVIQERRRARAAQPRSAIYAVLPAGSTADCET
jgi:hypothetical protein